MPSRNPDQRRIGELLRNPNAERVRFVEQRLAAAGYPEIRSTHLPIFEYIDHDIGSRITYLAKHANITVQAMGELVDYLAAHGYLERVPDPTDGRAKLVRLTEQGFRMYKLAGGQVIDLESTWTGYIGEQKMLQLKRLLAELWDEVESHRDDLA